MRTEYENRRLCLPNKLNNLMNRHAQMSLHILYGLSNLLISLWSRWGFVYKAYWVISWRVCLQNRLHNLVNRHRLWRWGLLCLQNWLSSVPNRHAWAVEKLEPHLPNRLNDLLNRHTGSEGGEAPFTKHLIGCLCKTDYSNLLNRRKHAQTLKRSCNICQDAFCFPQKNELLLLWVRILLNSHKHTQTLKRSCNICQDIFCFPQENELLLLWVRMWFQYSMVPIHYPSLIIFPISV